MATKHLISDMTDAERELLQKEVQSRLNRIQQVARLYDLPQDRVQDALLHAAVTMYTVGFGFVPEEIKRLAAGAASSARR